MERFSKERENYLKEKGLDENLLQKGKEAYKKQGNRQRSPFLLSQKQPGALPIIQGDCRFNDLSQHVNFFARLESEIHSDIMGSMKMTAPGEKEHAMTQEGKEHISNLIARTSFPVQLRAHKNDQRVLAELGFASGISDIMGGPITQSAYSFEKISLEESFHYWDHIDKLINLYKRHEIMINKEISLSLTGNLLPPSLQIALVNLDALLGVQNGASHFTLTYNQGGNLIQDLAAVKAIKELFHTDCERLLTTNSSENVKTVTTCFAGWSGGFPKDPSKSFSIIAYGGLVGALSGADKIITFNPGKEGFHDGIEACISAKKCCIHSAAIAHRQPLQNEALKVEYFRIFESAACILEGVFELYEQNKEAGFSAAISESFQKGIIDLPFSSMQEAKGRVLPARAVDGSIRFFDTGGLPLSKESVDFHKECLQERAEEEKRDPTFQMVIDDIYAAGKGEISWQNIIND